MGNVAGRTAEAAWGACQHDVDMLIVAGNFFIRMTNPDTAMTRSNPEGLSSGSYFVAKCEPFSGKLEKCLTPKNILNSER